VARHLDMGEQLAALAHEVEPAAQQIARRAHTGLVCVGLRQHAVAQQRRDLERVDAVVLRLAAVDRLHVQRVAQDEGDAFGSTQIGQPVPGEDALDGDDEVVAVRRDRLQERLGARGQVLVHEDLPFGVEKADVHRLGVQIDPAPVPVSAVVESQLSPPARMRALLAMHPAYSEWSRRRRRPQ